MKVLGENKTKTVLVTGGAGFIGCYTARNLLEKGYKVVIVDNFNKYYDPELKKARINNLLLGLSFKLYRVDIADFKSLEKVFKENSIDIVCHQAAQAGVRYSLENPFVYQKSNLQGTINVLECCKAFKVNKLVFASSSSVYGNHQKTPFKETDCTDFPISIYAATKKASETLCYSYHSLYKIPMVGLRYFTVFGPWGRPDMALFKFTNNILEGKLIDVYGEGKMSRDFTYIDDIIEGLISSIEEDFDFEIFNLGHGSPSGLLEFIGIIEKHTGRIAKKRFLPMQKGDVPITYADISKAKEMLDWGPKISLREGISKFIDWYKGYYSV
ncbi:MAG: SDR family NAD(P)-dependent oxidoreductase [Phenylobacterium sp.]